MTQGSPLASDASDGVIDTPEEVVEHTVRWGVRLALAAGAIALAVLVATSLISAWVWRTDEGALWALQRVPGIEIEGWRGAPGQGTLGADRLTLPTPAGRLDLRRVQLKGLHLTFRPAPGVWWRLDAQALSADEIAWVSAPSTDPKPLQAPDSLRVPIEMAVASLSAKRVRINDAPPVTDVRATGVHLGDAEGRMHHIEQFAASTEQATVQGRLRLAADAPLHLQASGQAQSRGSAGVPWAAQFTATGPLTLLDVQASLQGQVPPDQRTAGEAPSLQAKAQVKPFAPWPLGDVALNSRALDLSALIGGAPRTALDVNASVQTAGLNQPAKAQLSLTNKRPGAVETGALPVRSLRLSASGTPAPLTRLTLSDIHLELGGAQSTGGIVSGSGEVRVTGEQYEAALDLQTRGLAPAVLDERLPQWRSDGPLKLTAQTGPDGWRVSALTDWRGQLQTQGGSAPVRLALDATLAPGELNLRQLQAEAGAARADWQGRVRGPLLADANAWQWELQGHLREFDPTQWWRGEAAGPWRRGPHRLNLQLTTRGSASTAALQSPLSEWRSVSAQFDAQLAPSVLAGVAIEGAAQARLAGEASTLRADLRTAQSELHLLQEAQGPLTARVSAPQLAQWGPLLSLLPGASRWVPTAGSLQASASLDDWRALVRSSARAGSPSWRLEAALNGLQTPSMHLASAQISGSGRLNLDAPLQAQVTLAGLMTPGSQSPQIDQAKAALTGSLREHRLAFDATSDVKPPAWFEQLLGAKTGSGSRLQGEVLGRWLPPEQGVKASEPWWRAGQWVAQVPNITGQARDGSGNPWLAARDVQLELAWDARGLRKARALPGRLVLPGTAIAWQAAQWDATLGSTPQFTLKADIEPFELAPLLARAQPEMGWRGDLKLGGRIDIVRSTKLDADVVFERQSGDLATADSLRGGKGRALALGLKALRLALYVHDGRWQFAPAIAGDRIGELVGVLAAETSPERSWPHPQAPVNGVLQFSVRELSSWGTWLPPGWRADGNLAAQGGFGGTFGDVQITGGLTGTNLSIRNVLEGVDVRDGVVAIKLEGGNARIDKAQFKGGDGTLALEGTLKLGSDPSAQLRAQMDRFQALGRVDRRVIVTGALDADLSAKAIAVRGQLGVDEGLIDISQGGAPRLDDDVRVVNASAQAASAASAVAQEQSSVVAQAARGGSTSAGDDRAEDRARGEETPALAMNLAIAIDLGEKLRLKGRGVDTGLRGKLDLTTNRNRPQLRGTVSAQGGLYAAYGQRLQITRGEVMFRGPVDEAQLDILAERPNLDVRVGVAITGTSNNPQIRLFSEPAMSDQDKLSWLILGRAPEGLGQADTALLQRAAMALLAGEGESPTDAALRGLGLTDFSLRQSDDGSTRDTIVSLGKQISKRWYVSYERSVNTATGTWMLIYRAAQRFTLRLTAGNEDSTIETIWYWRWD